MEDFRNSHKICVRVNLTKKKNEFFFCSKDEIYFIQFFFSSTEICLLQEIFVESNIKVFDIIEYVFGYFEFTDHFSIWNFIVKT